MANIETITVGSTTFPVATTPTNMEYSTTEKVAGTWIDGKPVYQKTFIHSSGWAGEYDIGLSSLNVNEIILCNAVGKSGSGTIIFPLENPSGGTAYGIGYWFDASKRLCLRRGSNAPIITTLYLTIQYTKTTD